MPTPTLEEVLTEQIARHRALQDSFIFAEIRFQKDTPEEEGVLLLRRFIKRSDIVIRGKDRVYVIFPHTPSIYASRILERLRGQLGDRIAGIRIRVYPDDGSSPQDLLTGEAGERVPAARADDAWDVYHATPMKVLDRVYTRVKDGQALAVKILGHPWTSPERLLDRFLDRIRKEIRVVDLSVLEGEEITFDLWKEFFAELTPDPTPRGVAAALRDLSVALVIRAPHLLPREAFPFLRALWSALPSNASVLLIYIQEHTTSYAHQTALEQFLQVSNALVEVRLFPLSREDFYHLSQNLLHLHLDREELEEKYDLSGGYPALLFPLLEREHQFFYRLLAPLPEPIQQAVDKVRKALKPALAQFLQTLSVLGPRFTLNFAQSLFASEDPVKLRTFLERAEQAGWLRRNGEEWAFTPPLFWKGLYATLQPQMRRRFHKLVFDRFQTYMIESQDARFLLQLAWHAWGMEDLGSALSAMQGVLRTSGDRARSIRWLEALLEDFQDAPMPYPVLERTLLTAMEMLLAVGDPQAVALAEKLLAQAMGDEARARATGVVLETRIQLGDWVYLDRVLSDPQVERLLETDPDFRLRVDLRMLAAKWLRGDITSGKEGLMNIQQRLFQEAARVRGTLPLYLERLFAELHTLQAAFALVSGEPQKVDAFLLQASRKAQPEGFMVFLRKEIAGIQAFLGEGSPPEGEDIQAEIWRLWRRAREGAWDVVHPVLQQRVQSHSRYGRMAQVLMAWRDGVLRLEAPPPPVPGEAAWLSAFRAWLDAQVTWLVGKKPRWPSWDLVVDEGDIPAQVFLGMARMVDRPEVFHHIYPLTEPYPLLRYLVLEWAGWLGIRRDASLMVLARQLGSPWFEARSRALLQGEGSGLMPLDDQWGLRALERLRRASQR